MKRLYLLLLALAASFTLLTACGNDTPDVQIPETPDVSEASETPDASETTPEVTDGLTVVANGEAKFVLIRPEKATDAELDLMLALRNFIEEKTGVKLEAKDDWIKKGQEHDASAYEILIGSTNYNETAAVKDATTGNNMTIAVQGNKLVLYSPVDLGYYTLAEALESLLTPYCVGNSLVIPKEFGHSEPYVERLAGLPLYPDSEANPVLIDCGDDNNMMIVGQADAADFANYCTKLEEAGFTKYTSREAVGNQYATYTDNDQIVNLYFTKAVNQIRIIEEPLDTLPPRAEDVEPFEAVCTPAVMLVGQEYYPDSVTHAPTQPGLCLIFRLSDGRLIVVDGGLSSKESPNILLDALQEIAPDKSEITVAAWFLTHAHADHANALYEMYKNRVLTTKKIAIENLIYNFPTQKEYLLPSTSDPKKLSDQSDHAPYIRLMILPGTNVIKAHTGQMYHYGDATVEMLYTLEDYYPAEFDYHNTSSLVFRVTLGGQTVMVLGDASEQSTPILVKNYGNYLKSDMVQMAHHGYDGGTVALYNAIKAKTLLWPIGTHDFPLTYPNPHNKAALSLAQDLYVAGSENYLLELPYTTTGNKGTAMKEAEERRDAVIKENQRRMRADRDR